MPDLETFLKAVPPDCVLLALVVCGLLWDRWRLISALKSAHDEKDSLHQSRHDDQILQSDIAKETALTLAKLTNVVESMRRQ